MLFRSYAYFMKKVYRNNSLPYKPNAIFDLPENFDGCTQTSEQDDMMDIEDVFE